MRISRSLVWSCRQALIIMPPSLRPRSPLSEGAVMSNAKVKPRDRVLKSLRFEEPDVCPYYIWIHPVMVPVLAKHYGDEGFQTTTLPLRNRSCRASRSRTPWRSLTRLSGRTVPLEFCTIDLSERNASRPIPSPAGRGEGEGPLIPSPLPLPEGGGTQRLGHW